MRASLLLVLAACTGGTPTPVETDTDTDTDTDSDTDSDTDTDSDADTDADPCVLPATATELDHVDLGAVDESCFEISTLTYPAEFDTQAELAAARICDDLWPEGFDWDTMRLVIGAPSSCGTSFRDIGEEGGQIDVLLFGQGCGAPMARVHAIGVPDGATPVVFSICAQDTGLYP